MLNKDMIELPQMWRLQLALCADRVEVLLLSLSPDQARIAHTLPLCLSASDDPLGRLSPYTAAIEDLIYENPLLLADFRLATLLLDSDSYTIVPAAISEEQSQEIAQAVWGHPHCLVIDLGQTPHGSALLLSVEPSLLSFLRRTFPDAEIDHPLAVFARQHSSADEQPQRRIYAHLLPDRVMILALDVDKIALCRTFDAPSASDVAYYIMALWPADEYRVVLSGEDRRAELEQLLQSLRPELLS